ncbi:MAG TPA: zf-HC2 domain-containing protein, partial [Terriglobales bacterium]|nr:zf-HC2 domain-containing protein [Terriglobales bacterium]
MRCEDTQELITALVDNELTAEERRTIENHLGECEHCRSRHAQELLVKRQIRLASEAVTAPAGLRDWVRKEVEKTAAEGRPAKARSLRNWLIMPALRPALALLLVAVVVV